MKKLNPLKKKLLHVTNRLENVFVRGENLYLFDKDNERYLDFVGGWATNSLGHCPPAIKKALIEQSSALVNCSPAFYNDEMLKLADLLCEITGMDKVFFCSTGMEANESALKLCRKHASLFKKNAPEIISFKNSFHGRSLAMMSVSGKESWQKLFNPKIPAVRHALFNDLSDFKKKLSDSTSAVFMELVQGEGGVNEVSPDFITQVRKITAERNILLVVDEIQTGIGRTGKMFAFEHYGITPDILTLAKGLGGGFPIGAMLTKEKYDLFASGENGSTFSSQPLAMRVARAVVEEVLEKKLADQALKMGELLRRELSHFPKPIEISNIRGKGLLIGFDVPKVDARKLVQQCFANKLIVNALSSASIRLIPPLIVGEKEIKHFSELFKKSYLELLEKDESGG